VKKMSSNQNNITCYHTLLFRITAAKLPKGYPKVKATPQQKKYEDTLLYGANMTYYCDADG